MGTITSASSAKKWLTGTFLYVRLRDNPEHYKLEGDAPGGNLDERLETICSKAIALLEQNDLVRGSPKLQCTEFGDAMARYYLQFETMKNFLALPPKAKISEILSALAQAAEFKDIRFRAGEKPAYKELNKNMSIKFPLPIYIDQPAHKVSLVIQSVLGAIDLPSEDYKARTEYTACKLTVFQHANRLIRCIVDCQLYLEDSIATRNALMLARSLAAQVWDDSPLTMKQLDAIGPVYVRKLVSAGIKSIDGILSTEAHRIEAACSRNPPFGTGLHEKAKAFPRLRISIKTMGEPSLKKGEGVSIKMKAEIGFLNEKVPEAFNRKPVFVCVLVDTSDGRKVHFARLSGKKLSRGQDLLFNVDLSSAGQTVRGLIMCDEIAGTQQSATVTPEIPAFMFPTPKKAEALGKQREAASGAPNTSKRRAIAATTSKRTEEEEDFGDAGLDDDDLVLAEADGFHKLEDLDSSEDEKKPQKKPTKKQNAVKRTASEPKEPKESHQLANGKWTCHHACKDKTKCKHMCCRDGVDKKPKPPKPKEPKEPKDSELSSDPKQTRLDMSKMKKSKSSTQTAPVVPRKANESKEARQLNRAANNGIGSTSQVPLLSKFKQPRRAEEPPPDDFDLESLKSDALIEDDDMLDLTEDMQQDDNDQAHVGDVDLSSFADNYEANHDNTFSYFDDDLLDSDALNSATLNPGAQVPGAFDAAPSHPDFPEVDLDLIPEDKGIFITGDISESNIADPSKSETQSRDLEDDASRFFPPAKRQKAISRTASTRLYEEHEQVAESSTTTPLQGNESLEDVRAGDASEVSRVEEDDKSTQKWFFEHFGTDMFNYVE